MNKVKDHGHTYDEVKICMHIIRKVIERKL